MKLNTKSSILAGVAIALSSAAYMPQASAAVYNLGASGLTAVLTPFAAGAAPAVSNIAVSSGAFTDFFDFQLTTAASWLVATGNSVAAANIGPSFSSFNLYEADHSTVIAVGNVSNSGPVFSSLVFSAGLAANTTYSIGLSGTGFGDGGKYSLSVSTAPVPEPEEWAMMLVGAGLVGYQVRRKQKTMAQATVA